MAIEEVKSPLPERRYEAAAEEVTLKAPTEPTVLTTEETKIAAPQKKSSKLPLFLGIAAVLIVIFLVVFKVVVPKLSGSSKQVELTYWGLWEEPAVIESLISDYESQHPNVKITYVRNQQTNYRSRLQTKVESGSTDAPDLFRIHASWLPMFSGDLAKVPTDVATTIGLDTDYFDTYKNSIKSGNSWMGVPLMYDGLALFYNKDLVNSGQVNLPKSWWDLQTAANKLTVKDGNGKITVAGAALGLTENVDNWSDILGLMMKQSGVDILATDSTNTQKLEDVMTFYTLFATKYGVWDETLPNSTQFFANGKLAFYFAPSWRVFNIEETKTPDLKYGITTVPQLPTLSGTSAEATSNNADLTNINWSSYWIEGVNPNGKNQNEAWKFLEYLSTAENLEKMYTAASQLRSFGEIYPRKSMADKISTNEQIKPFISEANTATGWYLSSQTFDEGLNETMIGYFKNAINSMVTKNSTADEVMTDLRSGINQMVTKYKLK
jgi:ABC-type glycerol-3-phosphate transport system substrate-binding protein